MVSGLSHAADLTLVFDELRLDLVVSYDGKPLPLQKKRPSADEVLEDPEGACLLAGYLVRQMADEVHVHQKGERVSIYLRFDH